MFTSYKWIAQVWCLAMVFSSTINASETPISPTPVPGEVNLLPETLDALYGLENLTRVDDDLDQIWANLGSTFARAKAMWAGAVPKTFGYRDSTDTFHPIFLAEGFGLDVTGEGPLLPVGFTPQVPTFRWAIDDGWSSEVGQNPDGSDHMVTWQVTGGTRSVGNYVVAWEDTAIPGSDQDFNDLVVEISNAQPAELTQIELSSAPGEFSLVDVLSALYGLDNLTRVDDAADEVWVNVVNARVTAKTKFSIGEKILGYLREPEKPTGDISIPIASYDGFGVDIDARGPGTLPDAFELPVFRWQLDNEWSSWADENADCSDHMVTWRITGGGRGVGNYVIAWEDVANPASDRDFNDLVLEVEGVFPAVIRNVNVDFELVSTRVTYIPEATPMAPGGIFRIHATFRHAPSELSGEMLFPFFKVVELSPGNELLNANSCERGVGATLNPWVGGDDSVPVNETFEAFFDIGLQEPKPFTFVVDILGKRSPFFTPDNP